MQGIRYKLAAGFTLLFCTTPVVADTLHLRGGGALAHAVGGYQQDELSLGGNAFFGPEFRLAPEVAIGVQGMGLWLSKGSDPALSGLKPTNGASLYAGLAAITLYPLAEPYQTTGADTGFWLAGGGGVATTGSRARLVLNANVGWDVYWPTPTFGLGPVLGFTHVFQPDDQLRPEDANVFSLGVSGRFGSDASAPVADRDGDGVSDAQDRCPNDEEDLDNFEDADGCPDDDNDADYLLDPADRCPDQAEDYDSVEDDDGCPDAGQAGDNDKDKDGVADAKDKCPEEPEDRDAFQDDDGCVDRDNDADQIPDGNDLCPNERETQNDYADNDGCPDEDQVRVVGGSIVLDEVVRFSTNSAEISDQSHDLLKRLAKLVREHPEYVHISIEGHADLRGTEEQNQALSADRARAVLEFLVKQGVEAGRLSSKGFGSTRPLVSGDDPRALSKNRRVEFVVTRASNPGGASKAPTPGAEEP